MRSETVNLARYPVADLFYRVRGRKASELHGAKDGLAEARGASIVYRGALLPAGAAPATMRFAYTIPYRSDEVYEWNQTLPVRTAAVFVGVPQHKLPSHRAAVPIDVLMRDKIGSLETVNQANGRSWRVFRAPQPKFLLINRSASRSRAYRWQVRYQSVVGGRGDAAILVACLAIVGARATEFTDVAQPSRK